MPVSPQDRTGFALLEILIVLALLALVTALLLGGFRQYVAYQQFTQSVRDVELLLLESQTAARLSVGGTAHGVKIEPSTITQFVGNTYSATDPSNKVTQIVHLRMVPNLGGGDEIVFTSLSGYPVPSGSIELTGAQYDGASTITISPGGVVQ